MSLPRTYFDADYEPRVYEEVVWLAENDAALSEALNNRDYATLEALREENYGAFYEWNHYDIYALIGAEEELAIYTDMVNNINEKFLSLGLDAEETRRLYDECSYEYGVDSERLLEALSEVIS